MGYQDAAVTGPGSDGGIDVAAADAVAQVKWQGAQVGRPELQRLFGARGKHADKQMLFFAATTYSARAVEYADDVDMALFTYDPLGALDPVNNAARRLLRDAEQLKASAPTAQSEPKQPLRTRPSPPLPGNLAKPETTAERWAAARLRAPGANAFPLATRQTPPPQLPRRSRKQLPRPATRTRTDRYPQPRTAVDRWEVVRSRMTGSERPPLTTAARTPEPVDRATSLGSARGIASSAVLAVATISLLGAVLFAFITIVGPSDSADVEPVAFRIVFGFMAAVLVAIYWSLDRVSARLDKRNGK
ncbi:restriction endonuclease [Nocardia sp. CC227C]|uniref:restriction endonuclease n=1 Tax=Nocardia sp. CC227C TaxID=3044562 RepID=UPI00355887AE